VSRAVDRRTGAADIPAALDLEVFRQMADVSADGFYLSDAEGRFRYVNERAATLTGYSRDELLRMGMFDLDPTYPRDQFDTIVALLANGPLPPFEARTLHRDGTYRPTEVTTSRVDVEGTTFLFGAVRDISERKQMEEVEKTFAQRMLQTVENERQRVARELHDDVGQAVATLGVLLRALEQTPGASASDVREALAPLHAILGRVTESLARIVRDYHPADLLALGLEEALRTYARQFAHHHGLILRLTTTPLGDLLDPERELHVYRIAQGLLANVAQHAEARRMTVRLRRQGRTVELVVRDDGKGFDRARAQASKRLGLVTMRERAELIGGTLTVRATRGHGTEARLALPV
jgi:PAS domain S-box-containing protein